MHAVVFEVDMKRHVPITEPLFQELSATAEFFPAMNVAELGAGLSWAAAASR